LATTFAELQQLGPAHPFARAADTALMAHLTTTRADEAAYIPPSADVHEVTVTHGTGSFRVRVYVPGTTAPGVPLLVWCHGGAWALGGLDMPEADATAREVCARAGSVVVSVDYRLTVGGVHFPVPHDDVVAAYRWAVDHAGSLRADPARITLGGASAGANLAAGAALRLRDEGDPLPVALLLAYPCVHADLPPASAELQAKLDRLSPAAAFRADVLGPVVENYLGAPTADAPAYAMPGVADDLAGLPPTLVINCEYDGLRASGERFAEQLTLAGVRVAVQTAPDVAHGHLERPGLPQAAESHAAMAAWVATQRLPEPAAPEAAGTPQPAAGQAERA
jgi:acetyl esterase/lipase